MLNQNGIKVLSLFDGISGAKVALDELGIKVDSYFSSEIDPYAIQIAKANHPDIIQLGDVKSLNVSPMNGIKNPYKRLHNHFDMSNDNSTDTPAWDFDLLIGGFPCQSFSIAGNRKGFEDERGNLFFELLRILKEVKPKYFLFENVASMGKENQAFISEKLGVEPIMINSALLTAQQRKRLYWTNIPNVTQPSDKGVQLKDIIEEGFVDRDKSHAIISSIGRATHREYFKKNQGQLVFNKPIRVGQIGNGGQGERIYSIDGKSICLSALTGGKGGKTGLYEIKDYVRKLTPTECCRLQGFPDNYCDVVSKSQAYKALGNSFTVPVIKHILKNI